MSFDALPNELLVPILNDPNIPLQERIKFRAASPRWLAVIEEGLKEITKLTFRDHNEFPKTAKKPDDLVVSNFMYFDVDHIELIGRLFPSESELSVDFSWPVYFRQLPVLITEFSSTLQSLSLYDSLGQYPAVPHSAENIIRIAETLNSIASLTSLRIVSESLDYRFLSALGLTLGRLEKLLLHSDRRFGNVYRRFDALTDRCTHLAIHQLDFFTLLGKFDTTLTHLHLHHANELGLAYVCRRMTTLTSLTVDFIKCYYMKPALLRNLSRLSQLTELTFNGVLDPFGALHPQPNEDQPLVSVKRLFLRLNHSLDSRFDGAHFCSMLAAWFPSLERLTLTSFNEDQLAALNLNRGQFRSSTIVSVKKPELVNWL